MRFAALGVVLIGVLMSGVLPSEGQQQHSARTQDSLVIAPPFDQLILGPEDGSSEAIPGGFASGVYINAHGGSAASGAVAGRHAVFANSPISGSRAGNFVVLKRSVTPTMSGAYSIDLTMDVGAALAVGGISILGCHDVRAHLIVSVRVRDAATGMELLSEELPLPGMEAEGLAVVCDVATEAMGTLLGLLCDFTIQHCGTAVDAISTFVEVSKSRATVKVDMADQSVPITEDDGSVSLINLEEGKSYAVEVEVAAHAQSVVGSFAGTACAAAYVDAGDFTICGSAHRIEHATRVREVRLTRRGDLDHENPSDPKNITYTHNVSDVTASVSVSRGELRVVEGGGIPLERRSCRGHLDEADWRNLVDLLDGRFDDLADTYAPSGGTDVFAYITVTRSDGKSRTILVVAGAALPAYLEAELLPAIQAVETMAVDCSSRVIVAEGDCDEIGLGCAVVVSNLGGTTLNVRDRPDLDGMKKFALNEGETLCAYTPPLLADGHHWVQVLGSVGFGWASVEDPSDAANPWLVPSARPCGDSSTVPSDNTPVPPRSCPLGVESECDLTVNMSDGFQRADYSALLDIIDFTPITCVAPTGDPLLDVAAFEAVFAACEEAIPDLPTRCPRPPQSDRLECVINTTRVRMYSSGQGNAGFRHFTRDQLLQHLLPRAHVIGVLEHRVVGSIQPSPQTGFFVLLRSSPTPQPGAYGITVSDPHDWAVWIDSITYRVRGIYSFDTGPGTWFGDATPTQWPP